MTRTDPELGTVRRCRRCQEFWPLDIEFFGPMNGRYLRSTCRACRAELERGITPPKRVVTDIHRARISASWEGRPRTGRQPRSPEAIARRREQDARRKAAQRSDPATRDALLARERETQRRYFQRNRLAELERSRRDYAARLDRPVRIGIGRPRIAA